MNVARQVKKWDPHAAFLSRFRLIGWLVVDNEKDFRQGRGTGWHEHGLLCPRISDFPSRSFSKPPLWLPELPVPPSLRNIRGNISSIKDRNSNCKESIEIWKVNKKLVNWDSKDIFINLTSDENYLSFIVNFIINSW